jgi:hypothetical protein
MLTGHNLETASIQYYDDACVAFYSVVVAETFFYNAKFVVNKPRKMLAGGFIELILPFAPFTCVIQKLVTIATVK